MPCSSQTVGVCDRPTSTRMPPMNPAARAIGSILRFDKKVNTYKLALVRALNDVVLSYPELYGRGLDVCVPLRKLGEYWLAYYWPFVDQQNPIIQGPRATRRGVLGNDMSFRPALTSLRSAWTEHFGSARPSDGFLLVAELRVPRIAAGYPQQLQRAYRVALTAVTKALAQPIKYVGPGGETHGVFPLPRPAADWPGSVAVPGTSSEEPSVLVRADLWSAFRELSLWIEALCVHEWSLFTESLASSGVDRGRVYYLLTSRPNNRRPLSWERNQVELLMLEGKTFVCPWTGKNLAVRSYAIDHIIPVSVYPTNELWNLVPSDVYFNAHVKRARMPTPNWMESATLHLAQTYRLYMGSQALGQALSSDLHERFVLTQIGNAEDIANAVAYATLAIAEARSVERFQDTPLSAILPGLLPDQHRALSAALTAISCTPTVSLPLLGWTSEAECE